jgi:ribosomal protein S18 acetylase RimI-like enzyme
LVFCAHGADLQKGDAVGGQRGLARHTRGLASLSLETAEMAVANIRLYQRHGFEIVRRGLPDHGLDAHTRVYMVKSFLSRSA